jgi:hypothetical protein
LEGGYLMAYIGNNPANVGSYQQVDDISGSFNGSLVTFNLLVASAAISPAKDGQLLVSVNGVMQEPDSTGTNGFKVSGSTIVFSSAPASSSTFWAIYQGQNVDVGTPSAGTVGTTQLSATGTASATTFLRGDNSWIAVDALPTQATHTGKFLTTNGTAASWDAVDALPTQASHASEYLTTNGTAASWVAHQDNSVEYTATAGQTSFAATYTAGTLNVYLNGIKLATTDYTATTGTAVVLDTGAAVNDTVFIRSFGTFDLANHYTNLAADARFEPIDATIVKDADIGVNVQAYDATIMVDADIGVTVQAYDADTSKTDVANTFTATQTFTGYTETQTTKSASFTPVFTEGTVYSCTGTMTITMPTATAGKSFTIIHATATSITWAGSIKWTRGAVPLADPGIDIYTFISDGSSWYGMQAATEMS